MSEGINRRKVLQGIAGLAVGAAALDATKAVAGETMATNPAEELTKEIRVLETLRDQYNKAIGDNDAEEESRLALEIGTQIEKMNAISSRLIKR